MVSVAQGDASQWRGDAEAIGLVFTHPYAPIPKTLQGKPSIINLYHPPGNATRQKQAEAWIGAELEPVSYWGRGHRNITYVANLPFRNVQLADLVEEEIQPGMGWFPLDLPMRVLRAYADLIPPGTTVWDGFMGRGTVGKACQLLGYRYIGLDIDASRVALARSYLGV